MLLDPLALLVTLDPVALLDLLVRQESLVSVDRLVLEGVQDPTATEDLEVNFFLPLILIAYLGVSIYLCYCNIYILPILSTLQAI